MVFFRSVKGTPTEGSQRRRQVKLGQGATGPSASGISATRSSLKILMQHTQRTDGFDEYDYQ
jgi:hypothetical protein